MSGSLALPMDGGYGAASLELAQQWCREYTRRRAKNFYYAFASLPSAKRNAIYAVYAFSGFVDDIADEVADAGEQRTKLGLARARLNACYAGQRRGPLFTALGNAIDRFAIPSELFEELLNGVEMDCTPRRYATWSELYEYCYRVASMVGLICVTVFGTRPHADGRRFAVDLGIAMQLVNIMRDVREDAERGRVYFPEDELRQHGLSGEDILACRYDARFAALMQQQQQRAAAYFDSGRRLLPLLDLRARMCVNVLQGVYSKILQRIEAERYDVLSQRIGLSSREKMVTIAGLWASAALARRP